MNYYVILIPLVGVQRSYKAASPNLASSNSTPTDFFHGVVDAFLDVAADVFLYMLLLLMLFFICCCC